MPDTQIKSNRSNQLFLVLFAVYTIGVVLLLSVGVFSAVAAYSPSFRATLEAWGQGDGFFEQVWRAASKASALAEDPWQILIDYAMSILNLGFGIFIIWRRPGDWVARLLGLGMVGTAMAYNFQAHAPLTAFRLLNVLHYVYHATSGSTYLHALLLFPNGKLVPRRFTSVVAFVYFLMFEETLLPILKLAFGRALFLPTTIITAAPGTLERFWQMLSSTRGGGIVIAALDNIFRIDDPVRNWNSIIEAETTFFVLLFGLLIPVVGIISQVYRYRAVSSGQERQQTKFVVWALCVSFVVGLLLVLTATAQALANRTGLTFDAIEEIEQSVSWIFPLMVSVIPVALLFAILRYRLFDIDLVINRTLVYGPLTAILAGAFAVLSNILQRFFLAVTGSQSDIAVIVSALIVAVAFAPIKSRLQDLVDQSFKPARNPDKDLQQFDQQVQSSIELNSRDQILRHFLDTVVLAFNADGGAVYWGKEEPLQLVCSCGDWNNTPQFTAPIELDGTRLGMIALGARQNGLEYSTQDCESLKHTGSLVARAINGAVN